LRGIKVSVFQEPSRATIVFGWYPLLMNLTGVPAWTRAL